MTRRFLVSSLALVLLSVSVAAQNSRIAVSIPYDFTAGTRKLAAGEYLINHPLSTDPRVLGFRGSVKHQKAFVTTRTTTSDEPASATELTFARYGDAYFLRSVRIRGTREVYEVPISKAEKAIAAKSEPVMVTLSAERQ